MPPIPLLDLLTFFTVSALTVIALITLLNRPFFLRVGHSDTAPLQTQPFVSVLIPARNEAGIIQKTLTHISKQNYPHYEILLLDDHSDDGTGNLARGLNIPHLRIIEGQTLPVGWLGKNWACHQLVEAAQGEVLVFTDADVQWHKGALSALINDVTATCADLLTVWPTQITHTWAERLIVPLMALVMNAYLPLWGAHYIPSPLFAAANGQCMVWRREAYQKSGGHRAVRDNVLEDVTLARRAKSKGLRLRIQDGAGLITCRMYQDWATVRDGFAKNIIAGYGDSIIGVALATVFHWLIFLFPYALLLTGDVYTTFGALLIALGLALRAYTAAITGQKVEDALLMPLSVLLMTAIALRAVVWRWRGQTRWKGRTITPSKGRKSA